LNEYLNSLNDPQHPLQLGLQILKTKLPLLVRPRAGRGKDLRIRAEALHEFVGVELDARLHAGGAPRIQRDDADVEPLVEQRLNGALGGIGLR
jgi:hypothetical protein